MRAPWDTHSSPLCLLLEGRRAKELGGPAVPVLIASRKWALAGTRCCREHHPQSSALNCFRVCTRTQARGHGAGTAHFLQERLLPLLFYQPFCWFLLSPQETYYKFFNNLFPLLPSQLDHNMHEPETISCLCAVPNTWLLPITIYWINESTKPMCLHPPPDLCL